MRIRYRETGRTDDVESRDDPVQGPILVGRGDPCYLDHEAMPSPTDAYHIGPDTFEDWELVEATEEDCRRLRDAGFQGLPPEPLGVQED